MKQEAILIFFGCSEVNSTCLITSKLANQCERKPLFTCVVYSNAVYFCGIYYYIHYPVTSEENYCEAQSSITQYTTLITMLPAWLSWWCSGYHTKLACGGTWVQIPFRAKFLSNIYSNLYIYLYPYL